MKNIAFLFAMLLTSCTTSGTTDANNITGTWNGMILVSPTLPYYYQAVFTDTNGKIVGKNFDCDTGYTNCVAKISFSGTRSGADLSLTSSDGTNPPVSLTGTVAGNKLLLTSAATPGISLNYTKK
jgi:hypothetical protein